MRENASKDRFLKPDKGSTSSKITLTKEKQWRKRKREEEERRRREKAMVSLVVFIMATLETVLGRKKLLDGRNGPFGDNVFKNPARLFFVLFFCYFFITLP